MPVATEISDYFNVYVEVPKTLPQTLETHNFSIQTSDPESHAKMAVTVNFGPPNSEGKIQIMMNIQSFIVVNRELGGISEDEIWSTFETLRRLKNLTFESSITEKLRAEFR
jgi:uncharacterized protein (TIGR04255 family)